MSTRLEVMPTNCKTCPFREDGWTDVRELLVERALNEGSPVCHSTGSTALVPRSKRASGRQKLCRGARDLQLKMFHGLGVISAPTDEAWDAKAKEMGL